MANDSADRRQTTGTGEPSPGGIVLLVLACLPYALLVAMLPEAGDFPNEGGGEDRIGWGFQQFFAYDAWATILGLLWLAHWRASRTGAIAAWAQRTIHFLIPAAGAVMVAAMAQDFDQPGPWLPLVPILLPPAIGVYALWGCLPILSQWLPGTKIDRVMIGLIATVSLAVIPFSILDAASYPKRLEHHRAERATADATARAKAEQEDQAMRDKFARLGPDSSLRDYIEAQYWYLSGVDILAAARQVKTRQADAIAMLNEGSILDLRDLAQLDLQPTPALCQAYGNAVAVAFDGSKIHEGSAFVDLIDTQFPNMQWLRDGQCNLDEAIAAIDARLSWMIESKDPSGPSANDPGAFSSRWGLSRDVVDTTRAKLAGFRSTR
jgi:hypothetical protein